MESVKGLVQPWEPTDLRSRCWKHCTWRQVQHGGADGGCWLSVDLWTVWVKVDMDSRSCPCACEKGHNVHQAIRMQWIEPRASEEMLVRTIWHSITPFPRADASRLARVVVV